MIGRGDGVTTFIPFATLVDYLKLPGVRIDTALPETGGRLAQRLGGFATAQALTAEQRELGQFHFALAQGAIAYRAALRAERGDSNLELSERMLDAPAAQKIIAKVASTIFGKDIKVETKRVANRRASSCTRAAPSRSISTFSGAWGRGSLSWTLWSPWIISREIPTRGSATGFGN